MRRGGGDEDDGLARRDLAYPVDDEQVLQGKAPLRLCGDLADLALGEAGIGLQLQHRRGAFLGAGQAREGGDRAGLAAVAAEAGEQLARLERAFGQADHPPLMGGRKATSEAGVRAASPRTMA